MAALTVGAFDDLSANNLLAVYRVSLTSVSFRLSGGEDLSDRVRELADREAECSSFFTFTVSY